MTTKTFTAETGPTSHRQSVATPAAITRDGSATSRAGTTPSTVRPPTLRRAMATTAGGIGALLAVACLLAATEARSEEQQRGFWHAPSFDGLAIHTMLVRDRRAGNADDPAIETDGANDDATLARMKAYLAKGVIGPEPDEPAAWDALQAAAHRITAATDDRSDAAQPAIFGLQSALGLDAGSDSGRLANSDAAAGTRIAALVQSIDLPAVSESWFGSTLDVTLDDKPTEQLSGYFNVVHTVRALPAPADAPEAERFRVALTQPLVRSTMHADGRVDSTITHAASQRTLWGDDGDGCEDFVPGYRLGDADAGYWSRIGTDAYTRSQSAGMRPVGSVVSIVTRDGLPRADAVVHTSHHVLDPHTGFAQAIQTRFDVDADGVTDLIVWEGRGDDVASSDAAEPPLRHRLFFVNVLGQWHLLGHDAPVASCHSC